MPDITVEVTQSDITANVTSPNITATVTSADITANVTQADVTANVEAANVTVNITGGGSPHIIQDEGVAETQRANLNFVGTAVTVTDDSVNNATVVTITGGGGGAQTLTVTAGEDIAARDLIYIAADGLAYRADVTAIERESMAVADAEILTGDTGAASLPGALITGFSALTPGTRFFVSDTPGALSEVVQPAGAVFIQQVSHAVSETAVLFRPGFPIGVTSEVVETFYRLTEGGDIRITESGDSRVQE